MGIKMVAAQRGVDVDKARGPVKLALKKMVASNLVKQLKGVGATGSFRLIKAPVDAKSYRTPGAAKALPKTMKTVKKVLEGKKVTKVTKKKPAKPQLRKHQLLRRHPQQPKSQPPPQKKLKSNF